MQLTNELICRQLRLIVVALDCISRDTGDQRVIDCHSALMEVQAELKRYSEGACQKCPKGAVRPADQVGYD